MFVVPIDFLTTPTACSRYSFNASLKKRSNPVWMLNNVWICCSSKSTSFRMRCQLKHFQKQHSLRSNKWSDRVSWTVSSLIFENYIEAHQKVRQYTEKSFLFRYSGDFLVDNFNEKVQYPDINVEAEPTLYHSSDNANAGAVLKEVFHRFNAICVYNTVSRLFWSNEIEN